MLSVISECNEKSEINVTTGKLVITFFGSEVNILMILVMTGTLLQTVPQGMPRHVTGVRKLN